MNIHHAEASNLGDILHGYLHQKGYTKHGAEVLAAVLWAETVGPWYAQHTEVERVENGAITVHCDSAPLANQLVADSDKILERLNRKVAEHLGAAAPPAGPDGEARQFIREIRAGSAHQKRGGGHFQPAPAPPRRIAAGEVASQQLTLEEEASAQELAGKIGDEQLRRRFLAALRASLRLRHWQRAQGWESCPECDRLLPPDEPVCLSCHPPAPPLQLRS
jgi:predicted nucleic acid-binding Zn ribbon protein